jgi:hypothetical protein
MTTNVTFVLREGDKVVNIQYAKNLVVTTGLDYIWDRVMANPASGSPALIGWMALGEGGTAVAMGNTALEDEVARVALTGSAGVAFTTTTTDDSIRFSATFPAGTGTSSVLREAGLFNDATVGVMAARVVVPYNLVKSAGSALDINWDWVF